MGHIARQLGVVPDILRASCDDLRAIAAPDGGVLAYMETIARLSARDLTHASSRAPSQRPLVLAYGGALHNDAVPRAARATWSFGPALIEATHGRYLEIDLVVPELIADTDSWRAFPWYAAYRSAAPTPSETLLIPWGERSFALIFSPAPSST